MVRFWRTSKSSRIEEQKKNGHAQAAAHRTNTLRFADSPALKARNHSTDCTLAETMFFSHKPLRSAAGMALAGLIFAAILPIRLRAQATESAQLPTTEPTSIALPLAEDRGAAALEQSLRRLSTTASVLMIVAHPDDEDGALLTYLSRDLGARCTLLTLTRGEGGQNAMSADSYDALGLIRTNELLKAGEYYGAKQLWGTEIDFGFSKTQEEAFARWGHDRVLYDAVLAVRRERPQVIVSTFVGGITDGHGHHQVSGEIAQEAFKAAADPGVFPEQLKPISEGGLGLTVWQPLAVYSMVPFAPVTEQGMYDYATGKWAPAKFKNYVTGEWITGVPSTDVTIQLGMRDPTLGRSYAQIAREGWGQQKSQNGGANPAFSGPASTSYHLWAVASQAKPPAARDSEDTSLFINSRVHITTNLSGLAALAGSAPPAWLTTGLHQLDDDLTQFRRQHTGQPGETSAHALAPSYRQSLDLRAHVASSDLDPQAKASLLFELDTKIDQFQVALKNLLGLDLVAFSTKSTNAQESGGFRGGGPDETPRSVSPGEEFNVRVHTAHAVVEARVKKSWLESTTGSPWQQGEPTSTHATDFTDDAIYKVKVPADAEPTQPYFTRPNIEQPYYDLTHPEYRQRSFVPYPLEALAEFTFDGLPIRIGKVVQTMQRVLGPGGIYEPLVVTPAIGVRMEPEARILPLDGSPLPVRVTVHAQAAAEGTVDLDLPAGWTTQPTSVPFHLAAAGDTEPIQFLVTPAGNPSGAITIRAVAQCAGHAYQSGWQSVGYVGLRPYNLYKPAQLLTRKVDVKLAPNLRIGYIMGTGDEVPDAIEALGVMPHVLTPADLASSDLSAYNTIVVGIRAYSAVPALAAAQPRLNEFVRRGGTLIVQYQSNNFPAPIPLSLGRAERVVDESAPVKLLEPGNSLLTSPNAITSADFDGWVEERGHSFLDSWDSAYTALTETADPGQDPQRGGLVVAHPGKGIYIYVSYALYRQLPELVPGAYRILANLVSAGHETGQ
jgi:LmbE family N-acetylglucosaminyl deacetylase